MDPDGKALVQLTGDVGDDDDPAWSPDGPGSPSPAIAAGRSSIYVMNADGSDVLRLSTGTQTERHPTWSPDGRFIAFMTLADQYGDLDRRRRDPRCKSGRSPSNAPSTTTRRGRTLDRRPGPPDRDRLRAALHEPGGFHLTPGGRHLPEPHPRATMAACRSIEVGRNPEGRSRLAVGARGRGHRPSPVAAGDGVQPIRGRLPDAGLVWLVGCLPGHRAGCDDSRCVHPAHGARDLARPSRGTTCRGRPGGPRTEAKFEHSRELITL